MKYILTTDFCYEDFKLSICYDCTVSCKKADLPKYNKLLSEYTAVTLDVFSMELDISILPNKYYDKVTLLEENCMIPTPTQGCYKLVTKEEFIGKLARYILDFSIFEGNELESSKIKFTPGLSEFHYTERHEDKDIPKIKRSVLGKTYHPWDSHIILEDRLDIFENRPESIEPFIIGRSGPGKAHHPWDKEYWSWGVRDYLGNLLESYSLCSTYSETKSGSETKQLELFKRMIVDCYEDFDPTVHILIIKPLSKDSALYFLGYRNLTETSNNVYFLKTADELVAECEEVSESECNRIIEHFRSVYKERIRE